LEPRDGITPGRRDTPKATAKAEECYHRRVAFTDLTKQLAVHALDAAVKPAAPAAPEDVSAVMIGQIQAMQRALKQEDELVVLIHSGSETVRVLEIFLPSPDVVVLSGLDSARNTIRVVSHVQALQLACKVMKVQPPAKPARIAFITPKPK
jgi:hypothetical protein